MNTEKPSDTLAAEIANDQRKARLDSAAESVRRRETEQKVAAAIAAAHPDLSKLEQEYEVRKLMMDYEPMEGESDQNQEVQAGHRVVTAVHVRPDTQKKLDLLAEAASDGPWDKLFQIASEEYPNLNRHEAFRQACLDNPMLFEQWQDSLPDPSSRVPLAQV